MKRWLRHMDASTMQSAKAEVPSATSAFGLYKELPFKDVLGDEGDKDLLYS